MAKVSQSRAPIDVDSDEDDEESEKVGAGVKADERVEVSSSGDSSGGGGDDDDGDGEHEEEEEEVFLHAASEEIGWDGGGLGAGLELTREVVSHPAASSSRFKHHRVHIFHDGEEVATEDDEPGRGSGKHALGDASRSGLVHFALECGVDEPEIDLYTSPDLRECHLIGNDEERRFLGGVFHRTSVPEAEFLLSRQPMDDLTRDTEVAGIKALLLDRGARLRHGHVEAELKEKLVSSSKCEKELKAKNVTLSRQVKELEEKIEKGKKTLAEVEECMNRNIDLGVELREKGDEIEKLKKSC